MTAWSAGASIAPPSPYFSTNTRLIHPVSATGSGCSPSSGVPPPPPPPPPLLLLRLTSSLLADRLEHHIGRLFGLVVFVSDLFLTRRPDTPENVARFLAIASRLPLDLQMVLCNRTFGSPREIVSVRHTETAFQWLARASTWQ